MTAQVLLTNIWFNGRSGTEVVTRDYALGLARRGWAVAIHAQKLGPAVDEVRDEVPVVADLDDLPWVPDLIHGNQHPSFVPAMVRFPHASVVQTRHDWRAWHDESQTFERVRRHVAVCLQRRDKVVADTGLPARAVTLLPNTVDLSRCLPRAALPDRPETALVVANRVGTHVPAVMAALEAAGIKAEAVGYGVGKPSTALEGMMRDADIVVGSGRIALEAMAVGSAALVCAAMGLAGFVTPANFSDWRAMNFAAALLTQPVTSATVLAALEGYSGTCAAAVSRRVREEASLERGLDALEVLYREVLATPYPPVDREREAGDLSRYLSRWLPTEAMEGPFEPVYTALRDDADRARALLDKTITALAAHGVTVVLPP